MVQSAVSVFRHVPCAVALLTILVQPAGRIQVPTKIQFFKNVLLIVQTGTTKTT